MSYDTSITSFSSNCKTYCPSCSIEFSFQRPCIASYSPPPRRIPSSGFLPKLRIGWKFDRRRKSMGGLAGRAGGASTRIDPRHVPIRGNGSGPKLV